MTPVTPLDLEPIRELHHGATPPPWEQGHVWLLAGTKLGPDRCAFCHLGAPVESGPRNINGTVMTAHLHRNPDPYGYDHLIVGPDGTEVAGMYDYDQGGIVKPADTALTVALRNAWPALAAELALARRLLRGTVAASGRRHRCAASGCEHCAAVDYLAALDDAKEATRDGR